MDTDPHLPMVSSAAPCVLEVLSADKLAIHIVELDDARIGSFAKTRGRRW